MNDSDGYKDTRKMSDIILSLEDKITVLVKTIAVQEMNNRLILDRLNKLVTQNNVMQQSNTTVANSQSKIANTEAIITNKQSTLASSIVSPTQEINKLPQPIQPTENLAVQFEDFKSKKVTNRSVSKSKETPQVNSENIQSVKTGNKIPVSQRITDQQGKDLFMADVIITDLDTNEIVSKTKTTAIGKWTAYLPIGNYSVHITKIIDANTLNKIESLQEIEINPTMKSLQLPIAIIQR